MELPSSIEAVDFSGIPEEEAQKRRGQMLPNFAALAEAQAFGAHERTIWEIEQRIKNQIDSLRIVRSLCQMHDRPVGSMDRHPEHRRGINPRDGRAGSVRRSY